MKEKTFNWFYLVSYLFSFFTNEKLSRKVMFNTCAIIITVLFFVVTVNL